MLLIKLNGEDTKLVLAAARALQAAKNEKNKHIKAEEAAKEIIGRELLQKRQINLEILPDKEFVVVQCDGLDTVKISIKSSERFDSKAFGLVHPDLQKEFTKPSPAKYFDALL